MELTVGILVWDHSNQDPIQRDYLAPCSILLIGSLKGVYRKGRREKNMLLPVLPISFSNDTLPPAETDDPNTAVG